MSETATLETPVEATAEENAACLCGVPHCSGHEVVDGIVEIPHHPLGWLTIRLSALSDDDYIMV